MPDIREILKGLSPEDARLYSQTRTDMRRCYMIAHTQTVNISKWTHEDDMVLDLIDIQIAMLFDRSGRFDSFIEGAQSPDIEKAQQITEILHNKADTHSQRLLKQVADGANGISNSQWPEQQQK